MTGQGECLTLHLTTSNHFVPRPDVTVVELAHVFHHHALTQDAVLHSATEVGKTEKNKIKIKKKIKKIEMN